MKRGVSVSARNIKVKIDAAGNLDLRLALWKTHQVTNQGVKFYTEWLIKMRQRDIYRQSPEDTSPQLIISAEDLSREVMCHTRQLQRERHPRNVGSDAEILGVLRQLYELVIPSSVGKSGSSKSLARKFLSPLTDPNSKGARGLSTAGSKPTWFKMRAEGNPQWEEKQRQWAASRNNDPAPLVLKQLEDYGLLPLIPLFTDVGEDIFGPKQKGQFVRIWDRSMFQQAIERLMSWESWNQRVGREWEELDQKHSAFYTEHFAQDPDATLYRLAQSLEDVLRQEHQGFATDAAEAFRIRRSALKGFDRLLERWQKTLGKNGQICALLDDISSVQSNLGDKFGSSLLYQKLAEEPWTRLWTVDPTFLPRYATFNDLTRRFQRAKRVANLTLSDEIKHPIWMRYDGPDANGNNYQIQLPQKGRPGSVTFQRIIWPGGDAGWHEKRGVTVLLRPSRQIDRIRQADDSSVKKFPLVVEDQSSRSLIRASWGGAKIEFDREGLPRQLKKGVPDSVYLSLTVNLDTQKPTGLFRIQQQTGRVWLQKDRFVKYRDGFLDGGKNAEPVYVMSIDLGIRSAAAVSVFSVRPRGEITENLFGYPVASHPDMVAVHERSVLLTMPGEHRDERGRQYEQQRQELRKLRADIRGMNDLLRSARADGMRRRSFLAGLAERASLDPEFWGPVYRSLHAAAEESSTEWERFVMGSHRQIERLLSRRIQNLRSKNSDFRMRGGVSLAHVQDLENIRGIMASWTNHPRVSSAVVRWQRGKQHTIKLGRHILALKRDRVKKVANYLLMTAMGYIYDPKRARGEKWVARYPACQLMVFEDLSRYRFKTDRPRAENRQLMRWTHQQLIGATTAQAEPQGILVGTMYAGFSSRFDAVTLAPGVRGATVRQILLRRGMGRLRDIAEEVGIDVDMLRPHHVLPTGDGEYLLSVVRQGNSYRLKQVHADINAAHNLQRRLWTHDDVFRVSCRVAKNSEQVMLIPPRSYIEKYGKGVFIKGQNDVYVWRENGKMRMTDVPEDDYMPEDETMVALRSNSATLFRDPSGTIAWGYWIEAKEFWGRVNTMVNKSVRDKILGGITVDNTSAHAE